MEDMPQPRTTDEFKSFFHRNGKDIDAHLAAIYNIVDELMRYGKFDFLNQAIGEMSPRNYSIDANLGLLTASSPARSKLPKRLEFFRSFKDMLLEMDDKTLNAYVSREEENDDFKAMPNKEYIEMLLVGLG
jgi:hypothetical protein